MTIIRNIIILIIISSLLASCSNFPSTSACPPNAEIEWVDTLMINDIVFQHDFVETSSNIKFDKGTSIGEVQFKMADKACSNHTMKNGDAAFLNVGTPIYEVKGYPSSLVVVAEEKMYVVDRNVHANTINDLYPIKGLVKDIHLQSLENGDRIHTFSSTTKEQYLKSWLPLKLIDSEKLYIKDSFEGERVFLEIELENGLSFRVVYWLDSKAFGFGAVGNELIADIIEHETTLIVQ